jgi:hypothetical protein
MVVNDVAHPNVQKIESVLIRLVNALASIHLVDRKLSEESIFQRVRSHITLVGLVRQRKRARLKKLGISDVLSRKKSDTVFVFGSGRSILNVTDEEWIKIGIHDTIGFSGSFQQDWVNLDYLLLRGWVETVTPDKNSIVDVARDFIGKYDEHYKRNRLSGTKLIVQEDYSASFCGALFALGFMERHAKDGYFGFTTYRFSKSPSLCFEWGLSHGKGTLCDAINFAYLGGWKNIVLLGVDLYDSGHFFLPKGMNEIWDSKEKRLVLSAQSWRGLSVGDTHNTARNGVVDLVGEWATLFNKRSGVSIWTYNPLSLMQEKLPVYTF